jgi:hypothetical protein
VHEAFAATTEVQPNGGPIVPKAPPDPIEELPPDQKPAGDHIVWIPGYWQYDEERGEHIWVSGFWRQPPPGRTWVAGSWRPTTGGFQWTHGFWQEVKAEQPAQLVYLPPPPPPVEFRPSVPAPSDHHVYVPGNWVWRDGRYFWRAGAWVEVRDGWIWTPAHYRWTPAGYVYVEGYWDYPLADRGLLFAPVYFPAGVYVRPAYVYTPTIVIREPVLYTSLFVRRGYGAYYFGDYYEPRYATAGFSAWCGVRVGGVAVGVGYYDPMWSYYRVAYRNDPTWVVSINEVYVGRYNGTVPRPPRTLVQQTTVVNNITVNNVTNVTNVTNNNVTVNKNVNNVTMLTSINNVSKIDNKVVLKPVAATDRVKEQQFAQQLRTVAANRSKAETSLAAAGPTTAAPRTAHLEVPQTVVARAQAPVSATKPAPPAPLTHHTDPVHTQAAGTTTAPHPGIPGTTQPGAKVDPKQPMTTPARPGTTPPPMNPMNPMNPMRPGTTPPKKDDKKEHEKMG